MDEKQKEKLLELYPDYDKVLGPYSRKTDKRQHIVLNNSHMSKKTSGKLKTISYPKALKEIELGRRLSEDETVDHENGLIEENINNLVILSRAENAKKSSLHLCPVEFVCQYCGRHFTLVGNKLSNAIRNRNAGHTGPFCSRSCAGKASSDSKKYKISKIEPVYSVGDPYRLDYQHYSEDTVKDIIK